MEPPKALVPVGAVRERVIQTLTDAFANDLISVAELEERLEKAYRATTAEEAMALIAGLQQRTAPPPCMVAAAADLPGMTLRSRRERFLSVFSSQSRRGVWTVPRELDAVGVFSDMTIDLTHATLPRDIIDLHVNVIFANMTIVVPAGLRVVNKVGAFAANVESEPALDLAPMKPGSPVVRVTGTCLFGNLEIVSRFTPADD
jgi:hypothetical protein